MGDKHYSNIHHNGARVYCFVYSDIDYDCESFQVVERLTLFAKNKIRVCIVIHSQ